MAEDRGSGGNRPIIANTATTARGNVVLIPSPAAVLSVAAATTTIPMAAPSFITAGGRAGEFQYLESCWLDLTADFSISAELANTSQGMKEDAEEVMMIPVSPPTVATASQPCLLLPNIIKDMGLKEIEEEALMNANMKILDNFITDALEDSLDSFATDLDSNQSLIDDVETYLQAMSGGEPTMITLEGDDEDVVESKSKVGKIPQQSFNCGEVMKQQHQGKTAPEKNINSNNSSILKALVAGKVLASANTGDYFAAEDSDFSLDLTEEDLANAYTTTIKTESGQDVIIIIAQPAGSDLSTQKVARGRESPLSNSSMLSPGMTSSMGSPASLSDYEWSPSPANQRPIQRMKYQRKKKPTLVLEPYPRYPNFIVVYQP
jgi:hypothetical protein